MFSSLSVSPDEENGHAKERILDFIIFPRVSLVRYTLQSYVI